MRWSFVVPSLILAVAGAPARAEEAEPIAVAAANVKADNPDARAVSEALAAAKADVLVVTECTRKSLAPDTLAESGYRLLLDARDPSPWGICLLARIDGDAALVPAPWGGPCVGPLAVARFPLGGANVAVIGVHLPPRVPVCEASTDGAMAALAGLVKGGRLGADLGPARAGDPVVIAGDLNSEKKQLAPLRAAGLAEAGERAGVSLTTWSFGPVRMWLDHVFAPAAWPATDVSTFALPGSDHQGVYAAVAPG